MPARKTNMDNLDGSVPSKDELLERVENGRPLTQAEVSSWAHQEAEQNDGNGVPKGGLASLANSLLENQQKMFEAAGEVARKAVEEITKEDAAMVQSAEVYSTNVLPSLSGV
jgi:hypothetical protein